jgi:hypothetical protein
VSKTFKPPKSAINNAKKGLEFRKKYGRGGLTPAEAKSYGIDSGITRAKRIASGNLSKHDVRRMSAFNRHRGNYNPSKKMADGGPTAGTIAWLLWGGTSGVNWAKKKSAAMGAESFEAEDFTKLPKPRDDIPYEYGDLKCINCGTIKVENLRRRDAPKFCDRWSEKPKGECVSKPDSVRIVNRDRDLMRRINKAIYPKRYFDAESFEAKEGNYKLGNYADYEILELDTHSYLMSVGHSESEAEDLIERYEAFIEVGFENGDSPYEIGISITENERLDNEAESFEAQGTLKFKNAEILQILMNQNWKCSHCNNIIKNKQNIPFSEQEQNNVTWAIFEDLTNYDDINVRRNAPRSKKGSNVRKRDRTLNFDNLLLLCYDCAENRLAERKESISFRTSQENVNWLKELAKNNGINITELCNQIIQEYRNNYEAESFEADDDVFTHSVVLGFKFKYYTKQNPIYKKKEDGSFNLDPIHIVKLKILILREMDLVGVEYDDATITADSLLFKFNFTNEIEAQKFSSYAREYLSQNEKVEQLQEYFDKADARVMTKYEAGILFSTLMDWSNQEYLIDFLEYLIKLEEYDYDYSLQYIRERGVDINEQDDYGVSLKDLMLAEKMGYQSMLEELVNDLKNKGRRLDDVAFTLSADNGLKNQTRTSMFAIQQAVESGVVNKTMSLQFMRYQGKLQAIDDFLYYVYGDEDTFIFNNI